MRLTVPRVVEAVALYPDRNELFRNYPELEPEDVQQALAFAAAKIEDSAIHRALDLRPVGSFRIMGYFLLTWPRDRMLC